jgi:hypothetical protein
MNWNDADDIFDHYNGDPYFYEQMMKAKEVG